MFTFSLLVNQKAQNYAGNEFGISLNRSTNASCDVSWSHRLVSRWQLSIAYFYYFKVAIAVSLFFSPWLKISKIS